jgi:hypothetical protein
VRLLSLKEKLPELFFRLRFLFLWQSGSVSFSRLSQTFQTLRIAVAIESSTLERFIRRDLPYNKTVHLLWDWEFGFSSLCRRAYKNVYSE